jgi:hypothetical protein
MREKKKWVVHPLLIRAIRPRHSSSSGPVLPRRPERSTYRCFLPDLTGFANIRRVGSKPS